jgi:hypothetical protein
MKRTKEMGFLSILLWTVTVRSRSSLSRTIPHPARSKKGIVHNGKGSPEKDIQVLQKASADQNDSFVDDISCQFRRRSSA